MKAIIDGRRYNTTTADEILEWDNGRGGSDWKWRVKTLYRTPKGSWFIHHKGGPMTDCARACGDMLDAGEYIEPVSDDDAFAFLTSHDGAPEAVAHFADRIADA